MSFSIKRAVCGSVLTALVAGGVALTAVAPASAATVDTGVVKAAVQGDRVQGPAIFYNSNVLATGYYGQGTGNVPMGQISYSKPPIFSQNIEVWDFPAPDTWGPIMNAAGQCLQFPTNSGTVHFATCDGGALQRLMIEGGGTNPGRVRINLDNGGFAAYLAPLTDTSPSPLGIMTGGGIHLDVASLTPVVPEAVDCTAGLTGGVTDVDQAAKSAVVGGTGLAGETITVSGAPGGDVTAVVDASGNWSATIPGLVTGDNALTVNSSDNCSPVGLSVIIDALEIPVAHPAAAASAAVLGLGVFGFGLLRRRKSAQH